MSCVGAACSLLLVAAPMVFQPVAGGIQYATARASSGFSAHVFQIDLKRVKVQLIPAGGAGVRNRVAAMTAGMNEFVATNASFFEPSGVAMGAGVSEGSTILAKPIAKWPVFVVSQKKARIMMGDAFKKQQNVEFAVQGLPQLVRDGVALKLKPQRSERTAICAEGETVFLVVSTAVLAGDFADFLVSSRAQGGVGCRNALNLDGGPSTQMVAKFKDFSLEVAGGSGVPNALVFQPGEAKLP